MYKDFKVMVIGDYGLDIWREGESRRLSPEAPVPVVLNPSRRESPGLAGNVAANLRSLGAEVLCFGVLGADKFGDALFNAMTRCLLGGASMTLTRDRGRFTTVKERIISDGHQITRIDKESVHEIDKATEDIIIDQAVASMSFTDGVVISDYGKGVSTPRVVENIMMLAATKKVPVFVDPKKNLLIYEGATILKPNADEWNTHAVTHPSGLVHASYIVVTRGSDGMDIKTHRAEDGQILYNTNFPGHSVPVHDRTGAGDTAMAVMALEYLETQDIRKAVWLANVGGALAVQHSGTYVVTYEDIRKFVHDVEPSADCAIKNYVGPMGSIRWTVGLARGRSTWTRLQRLT